MSKKLISTKFIEKLMEFNSYVTKESVTKDTKYGKPRIKFEASSGIITETLMAELLTSAGVTSYKSAIASGSPLYNKGYEIEWQGSKILLLLHTTEADAFPRKSFTPEQLGLNGKEFNSVAELMNQIIIGIDTNNNYDQEIKDMLKDIANSVLTNTTYKDYKLLSIPAEVNKINSDFGEVLASIKSAINGNRVKFPSKSNERIADYYADNKPMSVKAPNGGGKVNLVHFANSIPQDTDIGMFLYSLATHNRDNFFLYGAKLSTEANILASWVGGTTVNDVKQYIKTLTYDEFYNKISLAFPDGLGLPDPRQDEEPRQLWISGKIDPFYFTLNTIINRLWGEKHTNEITDVVSKILTNATFVHVELKNSRVSIVETPFEDVDKWTTEYHSRSTKAFHNWMALQSVRKKDD